MIGLVLKRAGWPRAPFILGFVLGGLVETSYYQTAVIWGWSALWRPMTIVLLRPARGLDRVSRGHAPAGQIHEQRRRGAAGVESFLGAIFLAGILAVSFETVGAHSSSVGRRGCPGHRDDHSRNHPRTGFHGTSFDPAGREAAPRGRHPGLSALATPSSALCPTAGAYLVTVLRRERDRHVDRRCRSWRHSCSSNTAYSPWCLMSRLSGKSAGRLLWTFFWR